MEFDDILKEVNDFGPFQRQQWFFLFLTTIPQVWYSFAPVFLAMLLKEDVVTCNKANWTVGVCEKMNGVACPSRIYHTQYTSIITDFDMFCDDPIKISMTKSIYYIGMFFGAYVLGWSSDRYGRLFALFVSSAIQFVASLISSFSVNYWMFLFLRFPIGFAANYISSLVLCTEMVGPRWRNAANLFIQVGFSIGLVTTPLFAYLIPKWQYFNLAITLPNLLLISYYWITPESPRWLLARGLKKKSKAVMEKLAKRNKKQFPEHSWTLLGGKDNLSQQEENKNPTKNYNLFDLFKTSYLRKVTIIEIYCWFATVLVYYGLGFSAGSLSGNPFINLAALGAVEIPAVILAAYIINRAGRRIPLSIYYVVGGIALLCILPIQLTGNAERLKELILVLALIGKFSIAACFYQITIHSAELYPTVVRTLGIGTASASARIGGIIAPIIVDTTSKIVPFLVFGVASFIAGGLVLLLPETMGLPLPESFEDEVTKFKYREDNITLALNEKQISNGPVKNVEDSHLLTTII